MRSSYAVILLILALFSNFTSVLGDVIQYINGLTGKELTETNFAKLEDFAENEPQKDVVFYLTLKKDLWDWLAEPDSSKGLLNFIHKRETERGSWIQTLFSNYNEDDARKILKAMVTFVPNIIDDKEKAIIVPFLFAVIRTRLDKAIERENVEDFKEDLTRVKTILAKFIERDFGGQNKSYLEIYIGLVLKVHSLQGKAIEADIFVGPFARAQNIKVKPPPGFGFKASSMSVSSIVSEFNARIGPLKKRSR